MCTKCQVYLHDYFEQPLDKENPLYSFVNQNHLQRRLPQLIPLAYHLLFKTISFTKFLEAKSSMENYCNFVKKVESPYEQFELLYHFLQNDKKFRTEIKELEGEFLDLQFLRITKTDKNAHLLHRWLAFLLGSLFCDMSVLHNQHVSGDMWSIELDKGHPGRPDTAKKVLTSAPIPIGFDDYDYNEEWYSY